MIFRCFGYMYSGESDVTRIYIHIRQAERLPAKVLGVDNTGAKSGDYK